MQSPSPRPSPPSTGERENSSGSSSEYRRMHVLYVHQNYPAQFGHVARHLVKLGWRCTFVSRTPEGNDEGIEKVAYKSACASKATHYGARGFEQTVCSCDGV